jgi:hypothetical protein
MIQDTRVPFMFSDVVFDFVSIPIKREETRMGFSTAGGGPFSTGPKMNVTPLIDVLLVLIIVSCWSWPKNSQSA